MMLKLQSIMQVCAVVSYTRGWDWLRWEAGWPTHLVGAPSTKYLNTQMESNLVNEKKNIGNIYSVGILFVVGSVPTVAAEVSSSPDRLLLFQNYTPTINPGLNRYPLPQSAPWYSIINLSLVIYKSIHSFTRRIVYYLIEKSHSCV